MSTIRHIAMTVKTHYILIFIVIIITALILQFIITNIPKKNTGVSPNEQFINENNNENKNNLTFYHANWCGICTEFMPEWNLFIVQAQKQYPSLTINAVEFSDMSDDQLKSIDGFPTIVLFTDKLIEYEGKRTSVALLEFLQNHLNK